MWLGSRCRSPAKRCHLAATCRWWGFMLQNVSVGKPIVKELSVQFLPDGQSCSLVVEYHYSYVVSFFLRSLFPLIVLTIVGRLLTGQLHFLQATLFWKSRVWGLSPDFHGLPRQTALPCLTSLLVVAPWLNQVQTWLTLGIASETLFWTKKTAHAKEYSANLALKMKQTFWGRCHAGLYIHYVGIRLFIDNQLQ